MEDVFFEAIALDNYFYNRLIQLKSILETNCNKIDKNFPFWKQYDIILL